MFCCIICKIGLPQFIMEHQLINDSLKVGMLDDPPFSTLNSSKPGIFGELVVMFCQLSNIQCHFGRENHSSYGHFENGSWHGMMNLIINGKYDISFPAFTITVDRLEAIDFSLPVAEEEFLFVTRTPVISVSSFKLFQSMVFNWTVWLSLFLISLTLGVYAAVLESSHTNSTRFSLTVRNSIHFLSYITSQSSPLEFKRISTRCSLSVWGLGIVVLTGIYSGSLVSSLINGSAHLPFHDFATLVQCVESHDCELFSYKESTSSFIHRAILKRNDSLHQRLQKFISVNNFFRYTSDEMLNKIIKEKNKYIVVLMNRNAYLTLTDSNKHCLYSTVVYVRDIIGFLIAKNLSKKYKYKLHKFASNVVGTNLINRITSEYIAPEQICDIDEIRRNMEPVNIFGFFGFLFILATGCLLGCVVFLGEKFHANWIYNDSFNQTD